MSGSDCEQLSLVSKCIEDKNTNFVRISDNLSFNEDSKGFSLLETYSSSDIKKGLEPTQLLYRTKKFHVPWPGHQKLRNYFVHRNDPKLKDGAKWLLTPLTPEYHHEFEVVREQLVDLYKLRNARATRKTTRSHDKWPWKYQKKDIVKSNK